MQLQIEQGGEAAGLKEGKTSEAGHAKRKALLNPVFGVTLQTALDERVARPEWRVCGRRRRALRLEPERPEHDEFRDV